MRVLGLHFGHDAGISVVEDGKVVFLAHCERLLRQKKASGLSYQTIVTALGRAGLTADQIDYCAIASTQGMDIVLDERAPLSIELQRHPADTTRSNLEAAVGATGATDLRKILHPSSYVPELQARLEKRMGGVRRELGIPEGQTKVVPYLNRGILDVKSLLARNAPLRALHEGLPATRSVYEEARFDFNYPVTLVLDGRRIPASFVGHHAAHAAGTFYQSPFNEAAVMTLDGGSSVDEGGLFWWGDGNRIIPLRVHHLELGALYLWTAHEVLRLGGSAEGKMMGLAPYGQPTLFDKSFVGNRLDIRNDLKLRAAWIEHLKAWSKDKAIGDQSKMTSRDNADVAASMQMMFEETMLVAVEQLARIAANIGIETKNLTLSGGCMLNCPTNTRIFRETVFNAIHVEPACDDSGLPAGAALWAYHNLLKRPREVMEPLDRGVPYLGLPQSSDAISSALETFKDRLVVTPHEDLAAEGARRLADGQVLGWFEGRSEVGPRALGHRSIVADPRRLETWERVNTIKGRELWRPLAPSVLEEHAAEWFKGLPSRSPYMMFVGDVARDDVPAIAHIDGTARVQTVSRHCGRYYDLITQFHKLTGCAVVLNTSMNGPGEPIAEDPSDGIAMLLDGRFDALAFGDVMVERKSP